MKLGQILTVILVLIVVVGGAYAVFFDNNKAMEQPTAGFSPKPQAAGSTNADDPTYGQELRALTARLKTAQDKFAEESQMRIQDTAALESTILELKTKITALSSNDDNSAYAELTESLEALQQSNEKKDKENADLKKQLSGIADGLAALQRAQSDKDAQIKQLGEQLAASQKTMQAQAKDVAASVKSMFAQNDKGQSPSATAPLQRPNAPEANAPDVLTTTLKQTSQDYQPYSVDIKGKDSGQATNLAGLLGKLNEPTTLSTISPVAPAASQTHSQQEKPLTTFPVYTLPVTTILSDATLLTPLIGRVPFAGNVNDPFKFQLELGAENLAANGHNIPGIHKAMVAGVATGIREQSCARGTITALTFIFEDGRIHTVGADAGNNTDGGLGYLADAYGKPCIFGEYINNASSYLKGRSFAAFLQGLASAYSAAQIERTENDNGTMSSYISGNTYEFAAAQGISGTAEEIAEYVRERAQDAFDVIYVPQATQVQIFLEKQINIDYDLKARKTNYLRSNSGVSYD